MKIDMNQFQSGAHQDIFAYLLLYHFLGKTDVGYYLEIGASDPIHQNNTYFFEKNCGWKGVSVEIDSRHAEPWNSKRVNPLIVENATKVDYETVLKPFPQMIDYLSIDVDGDYDTVLTKIPFSKHLFKSITIEHDSYKFGNKYRDNEREILSNFGYYLLCPDVKSDNNMFEDWWIHPNAFSSEIFSKLKSLDLKMKESHELINILENSF